MNRGIITYCLPSQKRFANLAIESNSYEQLQDMKSHNFHCHNHQSSTSLEPDRLWIITYNIKAPKSSLKQVKAFNLVVNMTRLKEIALSMRQDIRTDPAMEVLHYLQRQRLNKVKHKFKL